MPEVELIMRGYTYNTDQGGWGFSTVSLIRGKENIIVDTAPHSRREYLLQMLKARGLTPQDVGILILTHAHWDHSQNLDVFPKARIVIHPSEVEYTRAPKETDWAVARYFEATLQGREVQDARDGLEIEPGVKVIDTPGHTKGHISVLVETREGTVAVAGDALPAAESVFTGLPMLIFWDMEESVSSIKKLLRASRIFYPGHDRPFKVGENNKIEYQEGPETVRIFGSMGYGKGRVSLTVGPEPEPQVRVF